jgi:2-haloacid dehalogenase
MTHKIDTVIFDLGGVLIDWNPKHLYRKIFEDEKEIDYFLSEICTPEWNEQQDAGRTFKEATEILVAQYPNFEKEIQAFYGRWKEMLGGVIEETVAILEQIHQNKSHRLVALTNWSAESFPYALENFQFLQLFEGILVSGVEKMKKPDPKIYELILDRYQIDAQKSVFIDDSLRNIKGAETFGIKGIHFQSPEQLKVDLEKLGIL